MLISYCLHSVLNHMVVTHETEGTWPTTPWLREEGSDCAFNQTSADWALPQWWCTLFAHHQVSAWDEDDVDFFIHAHLTGSLLLQAPQLLFHGKVCREKDPIFQQFSYEKSQQSSIEFLSHVFVTLTFILKMVSVLTGCTKYKQNILVVYAENTALPIAQNSIIRILEI